ncbi:MAG: UTRA domain-containing protein, partial [Polaromonas sp.]|nr:UTRA domain-containing protein [Polaromonas sp.]
IEMVTRATLADVSLAKLLDVAIGSALVDVMRIGHDKNGRPFEFQILRGPSDRFHTHVTIRG